MHSAPSRCPTCQHALDVRELGCPACATVVSGRWQANPFDRLSPEQRTFLLLFVRARGNLSDIERSLGVSYPTVRARVDDLIAALEVVAPAERSAPPAGDRKAILDRIARGEVSVDEGMARLRALSRQEDQS